MALTPYLIQLRDQKLGKAVPQEETKPKPIAKKSEKAKVEDKEYKKIVKEMLKESNECEIREDGCTGKAQGLHHKVKRGKFTLKDKKNLLRSCNACNLWVELHPLEAIEKGYSISKHQIKCN